MQATLLVGRRRIDRVGQADRHHRTLIGTVVRGHRAAVAGRDGRHHGQAEPGVVIALPQRACGLMETARIARYLADESAGQCGPCVFGLDAIAGQLERLATGTGSDLALLRRWTGQVGAGRGACKHPDGTVRMIASALEVFGEEVRRHARGWCGG